MAIAEAQEYIYIEQQYFISKGGLLDLYHNPILNNGNCDQDVFNTLSEDILMRIRWAIFNNKKFKVLLVLPWVSEDDVLASTRRTLWYMRDLVRGYLSEHGTPERLSTEYLGVISRRAYVNRVETAEMCTQAPYVHSKTIIVDDRTGLVGTANINDRSMMGNRDSEVGIFFEDAGAVQRFRETAFSELMGPEQWEAFSNRPVVDQMDHIVTLADESEKFYEEHFGTIPRRVEGERKITFAPECVAEEGGGPAVPTQLAVTYPWDWMLADVPYDAIATKCSLVPFACW